MDRDFTLSGIHDLVRSVHLDARPNHARNVISPFQVFMISCNKLHTTILVARIINLDAQFTISYVACILMHDQTTHGTLFNPFVYS